MVVDVLSDNGGVGGRRVLDVTNCAGVLELGLFGCETILELGIVAVVDVAVLNTGHFVGVLFWENLFVLDGLDGGVVVVLVDLPVYDCLSIFVLITSYILVLYGRVDCL